jgi:hypothetical protein
MGDGRMDDCLEANDRIGRTGREIVAPRARPPVPSETIRMRSATVGNDRSIAEARMRSQRGAAEPRSAGSSDLVEPVEMSRRGARRRKPR